MFAIKTESIKSYVEAPKSLLKDHRNLIALIADNGNHFLRNICWNLNSLGKCRFVQILERSLDFGRFLMIFYRIKPT